MANTSVSPSLSLLMFVRLILLTFCFFVGLGQLYLEELGEILNNALSQELVEINSILNVKAPPPGYKKMSMKGSLTKSSFIQLKSGEVEISEEEYRDLCDKIISEKLKPIKRALGISKNGIPTVIDFSAFK